MASPTWGPWKLSIRTHALTLTGPTWYEIDLDRCLTSSQVLDWICQVSQKRWADSHTIASLIHALGDILDPQANLCSFGADRQLTREQARKLARIAAGK